MIQIFNEDCLFGIKKLKDKSIDRVVTSPPYNIGLNYNSYRDKKEYKTYCRWLQDIFIEIYHKLKDDGHVFLNLGGKPTSPMLPLDTINFLSNNVPFVVQNIIHWVKNVSVGDNSYGHFKPINSPRYLNDCQEYIFHLTKDGNQPVDRLAVGVPYQDASNTKRYNEDGVRCKGNVWFIPYKTVKSKKKHPAAFPLEVPLQTLKFSGAREGMIVLDPFMGEGTTAKAAKVLELDCIGYEIDKDYFKDWLLPLNEA